MHYTIRKVASPPAWRSAPEKRRNPETAIRIDCFIGIFKKICSRNPQPAIRIVFSLDDPKSAVDIPAPFYRIPIATDDASNN